jgi:hypothetical protein
MDQILGVYRDREHGFADGREAFEGRAVTLTSR